MNRQMSDINLTIDAIKEFLPKLVAAASDLADRMYGRLDDQSWMQVSDVVEGIDDLYKTLSGLNEDLGSMDPGHPGQKHIKQAIDAIKDAFRIMNDYMDREDYAGAGDIIIYELNPVFDQLFVDLGPGSSKLQEQFASNMNYIRRKQPSIYAQISGVTRDWKKYRITNSNNGSPNLCVALSEGEGVFLHSRYNPGYEASKWVGSLAVNETEATSVFFYGFGLGYQVVQYAELYPQFRLYIYEPNVQIFMAAMEVFDFVSLFESNAGINFVLGTDRKQKEQMFYHFARYMKGEPHLFALPKYDRIEKNDLDHFYNEAAAAVSNFNSSIKMTEMFGTEWVRNSLYNLQATLHSPSLSGLKNKFEGKTAIIIGAGPSLELDVEWLHKLKKHAILIAAGSAIQSLLHYGITPHLIVSIDGGEPNYNVFKNINIEDIPLVFAPMINYQIIDRNHGNLIHLFLDNDSTMDHFLEVKQEEPRFLSTYSVTGTAVQAAIFMGCHTIVFTGQDLSYPDNTMYAAGARHKTDDEMKEVVNRADLFVENVQGGRNRISPGMGQTLANIEALLEQFSDIRFVNASSKGAKIKHTIYQPMSQVYQSLERELVDDAFVKNEIAELNAYNETRISYINDKIKRLPMEMDLFEERLAKLERQLKQLPEWSRRKPSKCLSAFQEIDSDWKAMLRSDPFQGLYLKVSRNELLEFERDLPVFAGESNLIKKADFAIKIMLPLIQSMLGKASQFKGIVSETLYRLEGSKASTHS